MEEISHSQYFCCIIHLYNFHLERKQTRRAFTNYDFESSVCSVSETKSILVAKRQRTENSLITTFIHEESTQPPAEETNFGTPVVSHPDLRIQQATTSPPDYDYSDYEKKISMSAFDVDNQIQSDHKLKLLF